MTPTREAIERLARDCEITAYRSSGPGGQKKNKTASSIRARHVPSGIVRIATEHRSQTRNRRLALERIWRELARRAKKRKARLATRPSAGAVERRLDTKRRLAERKRERHSASRDE